MDSIGNDLWLVGATLLSLIVCTFGGTSEGIGRSTSMNLIVLKSYQEQVATYGGRADEILRLQFMDKWKSVLDSQKTAIEILNHVEKDWMYILYLVSSSEDVTMGLIMCLHVKILALHQLMTYLPSILYYTLLPAGARLNACCNVAAHLIVFTHEGTDELLKRFLQTFDSLLSADELKVITRLGEDLQTSRITYTTRNNLFKNYDHLVGNNNSEIHQVEMAIQNGLNHLKRIDNSEYYLQVHLLLKFMFGALDESVQDEAYVGLISDLNHLKHIWIKVEDINKYITKQTYRSPAKDEYTMTDVIRANIIWKSEVNNVYRRNISEKFECMLPNKFQIFISNNQVMHNANLEDQNH